MKKDLSVMYLIRSVLRIIKEEMDKKGLSFDEFQDYWDEAIERMEKESVFT